MTTQTHTDIYHAARSYAAQGIPSFACVYGAKKPATPNGFHDATTDKESLGKWFNGKTYNIGIPTGEASGLVVVDDDCYKPGAKNSLKKLEAKLGKLPTTYKVKTRAGGYQYYFKCPAGSNIRNSTGALATGIDIRGEGGYVVAAPSWVDKDDNGPAGFYEVIDDIPVAELTQEWVTALQNASKKAHKTISPRTGKVSSIVDALAGFTLPKVIPKGTRNDTLFKYACHLRGRKVPQDIILQTVLDVNKARCEEPLAEDEALSIIRRYEHQTSAENTPEHETDWPEPEEIAFGLPDVPSLDLDMLPEAFRPYVEDASELMQAPAEYVAIPLMISAAAALGNGFAIAPKAHDISWQVIPVLWGGNIGRPGTMKSPAMDRGTTFLTPLEQAHEAEYRRELQQHEADKITYDIAKQAAKQTAKKAVKNSNPIGTLPPEPREPQPERLVVNDSTVQKVAAMLEWSPRGLLVIRDELTGLLESLRTSGQEEARAFYLAGWNGNQHYRVDRIGRGSFVIPQLAVWIVGGIQPGKLQNYIRQAIHGGNGDDGLMQRFQLLVWPDPPAGWENIDRRPDAVACDTVKDVFKKLRALDPSSIGAKVGINGGPAYLHFTTEAQNLFNDWHCMFQKKIRTTEQHPALVSHFAKYSSLIPALALVIHLADGRTGPVTKKTLNKAISWGSYLGPHAKRVYSAATNAAGDSAKTLSDKIIAGKLRPGFTAREIQRNGWSSLSTHDDVRVALDWLIDANWIRPVAVQTNGRSKTTYTINPGVNRK